MRKLDYKILSSKIQSWIKDYVNLAKADGIVIGISGGIDSAVTAALSVRSIGKDKVVGLGLPCSSLPQDLEDAKLIVNMLGIKFFIIDLTSVYNEFMNLTSPLIESNKIAKANLKPRLRMMAVYFVGQSMGRYLVCGTGNRTELAIGYFTKYGDGGVDFEPIGGLYKSEVRELARILGIPEKIIKKPPSAGLWKGQTDEGEIGLSYDTMDEILYRLDHNLDLDDLDRNDIAKVKNMMISAQHKMKMPPIYTINKN